MLNIPSLTKSSCCTPPIPFDEYAGYVGKNTDEGPMLCGGYGSGYHLANDYGQELEYLSDCFILTKNGNWVRKKGMNSKRNRPAAVETSAGWWVTGEAQA